MSQLLTSNNQQSSYAATWNDAATVFTAWKLNVTDTASNSGSLLLDLQVGGSSRFSITKASLMTLGGNVSNTGQINLGARSAIKETGSHLYLCNSSVRSEMLQITANGEVIMLNSGRYFALTPETRIYADAANTLALRNTTNTQAFRVYRTYTDSSNYEALELAHATYSSAQYSILRTITAGTGADNINLVLSPSGTGAIVAQMPDGTTTGGDARGTYAVDLQLERTGPDQVASGSGAFAAGQRNKATNSRSVAIGYANTVSAADASAVGRTNTVSGSYCFAAGENNAASSAGSVALGRGNTASGGNCLAAGGTTTASGTHSISLGESNTASGANSIVIGSGSQATASRATALGFYSLANKHAQLSHAAGLFADRGDAQRSVLVMRCLTTDDSKTQLYLDGASLQATIPNNTAWHADIRIVGRENAGANHAVFHRKVGIYKNTTAASATLLGTVQTIGTDYKSDATWAVTITADTGTGALKVEAQGNLDQDVRWVAEVSLVEVAFA